MENERAFFEQIANTASQGWDIKIADHVQPGALFGTTHDVRFYLVDTSRNWIAAGAASQGGFRELSSNQAVLGMSHKDILDIAASGLVNLSDKDIKVDSVECQMVVRSVAAALVRSKTFKLVEEKGTGLAGHWFYVAYRFPMTGDVNCRPLFVPANSSHQFLPMDELDYVISTIIKMDCDPKATTEVARFNRANGGVKLHPKWASLMA